MIKLFTTPKDFALSKNLQAQFNIWCEGFDAFDAGLVENYCPYPISNHQSRKLWLDGWRASLRTTELQSELSFV